MEGCLLCGALVPLVLVREKRHVITSHDRLATDLSASLMAPSVGDLGRAERDGIPCRGKHVNEHPLFGSSWMTEANEGEAGEGEGEKGSTLEQRSMARPAFGDVLW